MEQYIHTLIPARPTLVPTTAQVANFFELLVTDFNFRAFKVLPHPRRQLPGLMVRKPTGLLESVTNRMTGEVQNRPEWARITPERFADIPPIIDGLNHYVVQQKGEWGLEDRPLILYCTDRTPFEKPYLCDVRCELRPEPVTTSAWDLEAGPNVRNVPRFASACEGKNTTGVFPNPWTGDVIEVPDADCARFWIEFEFGKFIYPDVTSNLDLFRPSIISRIEECFETRFAQGCRFW